MMKVPFALLGALVVLNATPAFAKRHLAEHKPEAIARVCRMIKEDPYVRVERDGQLWLAAHCAPVAQYDRIGEILDASFAAKTGTPLPPPQPGYREHR